MCSSFARETEGANEFELRQPSSRRSDAIGLGMQPSEDAS